MLISLKKINKKKFLIFTVLFLVNIGFKGVYRVLQDNESIVYLTFFMTIISVFIIIVNGHKSNFLIYYCFLLYLLLLAFSFSSQNVEYGLQKAFLGLMLPLTIFIIFKRFNFTEKETVRYYVAFIFILSIYTLLYKLNTKFFDRYSSYGFFGPITFGWLSGMAYILVLFRENKKMKDFLFAFYFFLLVLWTGSKGPLVGVLLVSALNFNKILTKSFKTKFFVVVFLIGSVYFVYQNSENIRSIQNFVSLYDNPQDYIDGAGSGSFGSRIEFARRSINVIAEYPFFGVGFGDWGNHTGNLHQYPHNIVLELLSETGLFFVILFSLLFIKSKPVGVFKTLAFFGMITLFVSGDFSYFRYTFFPFLLSTYFYNQSKNDKYLSQNK